MALNIKNFFDVRDKYIGNNQVDMIERYLSKLETNKDIELFTDQIEEFIGEALYHKNHIIVSHLNLFIRENNIQIKKMNVLKAIYSARCRDVSKNNKDDCISFAPFDDPDCCSKYIHGYWHLFSR